MDINRKLVIRILKYLDEHPKFYFPFLVVCKEYTEEDDDFVEVEPNEWRIIKEDDSYQTFQLWENLQNLDEKTLALMAKGFIEKMTGSLAEHKISQFAKQYRSEWNEKAWESDDSQEYGLNEFFGGKAEGFEEARRIIRKYRSVPDNNNSWLWSFL